MEDAAVVAGLVGGEMEKEAERVTATETETEERGGEEEPMKANHGKLFVGGVPLGTSEAELRAHFAQFGRVAFIGVPKNRLTGAPRGFAFVQFASTDDAERALSADRARHVVHGGTVEVKLAAPKPHAQEYRSRDQFAYLDPSDHPLLNKKKIFVGGLPPSVGDTQLREYFDKFGEITRAIVVTEIYSHVSRGFGFVEFASEESAAKVLEIKDRHCLGGVWVEARYAMPRACPEQDNDVVAAGPSSSSNSSSSSSSSGSKLSVLARPFYPARSLVAAAPTPTLAPAPAPALTLTPTLALTPTLTPTLAPAPAPALTLTPTLALTPTLTPTLAPAPAPVLALAPTLAAPLLVRRASCYVGDNVTPVTGNCYRGLVVSQEVVDAIICDYLRRGGPLHPAQGSCVNAAEAPSSTSQ